jgi:RNA polymerase sigma-70 factor (ECF subfamily)
VRADTDAAVISASCDDPSRFAEVFDRHGDAIHSYLRRRVGPHLAEDLAAATFEEAFRSRARYDLSREDARPWLYGIAANLLRHHRREERRQLLAYARTRVEATVADETEAAESRVAAGALAPRIALALASLRAEDRETLLLLVWGQLSYVEIAEALDIPVGTVRSRLNRARTRARELIGETGQYLVEDDVVPRLGRGNHDG